MFVIDKLVCGLHHGKDIILKSDVDSIVIKMRDFNVLRN